MTGPIELMAGWQQAVICIGLFVIMIVLQCLPKPKPPSREQKQPMQRPLDTSQPPSWWEDRD